MVRRLDQAQSTNEVQVIRLLEQRWVPAGVELSEQVLAPEVIASLVQMSAGNFRLLSRLLAQVERILKVSDLTAVTKDIVAAARNSLVIGQAQPNPDYAK